jgi:hypothetical protein
VLGIKWIHHILKPHCPDCAEERECKSCEVLKQQLEAANHDKERLLNMILDKNTPREEPAFTDGPQPVRPKHIPMSVRRQMLEQEDRQRARISEEKKKEIEDLEKELGVSENAAS